MAKQRALTTVFGIALLTFASPAFAEPDTCAQSLESTTRLREQRRLLVAKAMAHECAASPACSAETRAACVAAEADLAKKIPTITIVDGDGRASLALDQGPVTSGVAYSVDPGQHVIALQVADGQRREETIIVSEGDRARVVMLAPARSTEAPLAAAAAGPTNGPYFVAGGGLLLLLGAATMQTFARVEEADAKSLWRDAWQEESRSLSDIYKESGDSHHDAAVVNQTIAITLAVLGSLTVAVGATWWVTSRTGAKSNEKTIAKNPFRLTF